MREREREREYVCVCVRARARARVFVCVCVYVKTATVKMSLTYWTNLTYPSSPSCIESRSISRGTDARAACTVALGIQESAINSRSLKLRPTPYVEKKATGVRTHTPMPGGVCEGMVT